MGFCWGKKWVTRTFGEQACCLCCRWCALLHVCWQELGPLSELRWISCRETPFCLLWTAFLGGRASLLGSMESKARIVHTLQQRVGLLVVTPFVSSPGDDLHLVIWFYLGKLINAFGRGFWSKTKIIRNRKTTQKNLSYFKRVKCLPVAFKPFFPSSSFIKF